MMNSALLRTLATIALMVALAVGISAQNPSASDAAKATGTISGKVLLGDQPAPGVEVLLTSARAGMTGSPDAGNLIAVTDVEGRYKVTNVPAGGFRVSAFAPAYVIAGENNPWQPGRSVTLSEGEVVTDVNFNLTRGGVVTGRVTSADGRAVIGERINLTLVVANGQKAQDRTPRFSQLETDDRGVYRAYGVAAGRYLVSAGASPDDINSGDEYRQTFYPDAIEESAAKIIEVTAGGEVENIDIKLARATKGYTASGRVIDADTGKPIAGMTIGYIVMKESNGSFGTSGSITNSQGEFRLDGLFPNPYATFAMPMPGNSDNYSDQTKFEIVSGDVSGLEIKMHRGGSISGIAVIEGTDDPAIRAKLTQMSVYAQNTTPDQMIMRFGGNANINADGTFRIGGVLPGKVRITRGTYNAPKGLSLLRVELNGTELTSDLEIGSGENISGVRLVFAYGSSVVVGHVEIKGGPLPETMRLSVAARRDSGGSGNRTAVAQRAEVDSRGQFLIEGLATGNYIISVSAFSMTPPVAGAAPPKPLRAETTVTIGTNARQEVTLILDLTPQDKNNQKENNR